MAVQVTLSDLTNKVNEGWKKDQLAEYYGLPKAQVGKLLKQAGLTIRKFHLPKFELVDDTANATDAVTQDYIEDSQNESLEVMDMVTNGIEELSQPEATHEVATQETPEPVESNTGNW